MSSFDSESGDDKSPQSLPFRHEEVYILECSFCWSRVCERGMKSFLIADEKVELFSTDNIDRSMVNLTNESYRTEHCRCQIQNIACLQCGNIVGYHVSKPCRPCLEAQNNGHYWMYYRHAISPYQRLNREGTEILLWGELDQETPIDIGYSELWDECER